MEGVRVSPLHPLALLRTPRWSPHGCSPISIIIKEAQPFGGSCHFGLLLFFSVAPAFCLKWSKKEVTISQPLHLTEWGQDAADRLRGLKQLPNAYLPVCFVGTTPSKSAPKISLGCLPLLPSDNLTSDLSFAIKSQRLVQSGSACPSLVTRCDH